MWYWWLIVFIMGIALILLLRRILFSADTSRAARLMKTYKHMTPALLAQTADEELVSAVVANLLAKAEQENRDPYAVIPVLSQERCAIYSIWAVRRELQSGDPQSLRHSTQFGFSELAADGMDLLGMSEAAQDLRTFLQTADEACLTALHDRITSDACGNTLIAFIRDNAPAFCDE